MLRKLVNLVGRNNGVVRDLPRVAVHYDHLFIVHYLVQMLVHVLGKVGGTVILEALD